MPAHPDWHVPNYDLIGFLFVKQDYHTYLQELNNGLISFKWVAESSVISHYNQLLGITSIVGCPKHEWLSKKSGTQIIWNICKPMASFLDIKQTMKWFKSMDIIRSPSIYADIINHTCPDRTVVYLYLRGVLITSIPQKTMDVISYPCLNPD